MPVISDCWFDDHEEDDESFGSCDECGGDLIDEYESEIGLCQQCEWAIDKAGDQCDN